jgi:hypothetical protein
MQSHKESSTALRMGKSAARLCAEFRVSGWSSPRTRRRRPGCLRPDHGRPARRPANTSQKQNSKRNPWCPQSNSRLRDPFLAPREATAGNAPRIRVRHIAHNAKLASTGDKLITCQGSRSPHMTSQPSRNHPLQNRQHPSTRRHQMHWRRMRLERQHCSRPQQHQPPHHMENLTKQASHMLKKARYSSHVTGYLANPLDKP